MHGGLPTQRHRGAHTDLGGSQTAPSRQLAEGHPQILTTAPVVDVGGEATPLPYHPKRSPTGKPAIALKNDFRGLSKQLGIVERVFDTPQYVEQIRMLD